MRFPMIASVLTAGSLLANCAHYEAKDHARLCGKTEAEQFLRSVRLKDGQGVVETTFIAHPEISNGDKPINAQVFWVRLRGFTKGRKAFTRSRWEGGTGGIPMLYSTEFAYVEKEDGSRISAEPEIRFSSRSDPDQPGEIVGAKVVDLNSDEVQMTNKHGWSLYGDVYIKFNMPPPLPTSRWKVHLGRVVLGDNPTEIPEQYVCVAKGYSVTVWGNLP
jgi:hypothetical protein